MIRLLDEGDLVSGPGGFPIPDIVCALPERLTASAWLEHVPFAFWLGRALQPQRFVELGTHTGVSYCAFLQAFASLGLPSEAFAVDTWQGDAHAGLYDEQVYQDLKTFTSERYGATAKLLRMTFDEALPLFEDGSIDLLHIDGFHSFEAVSHDFATWRPKLSARGVVLFHDTQVFERGFGVWRLWHDLAATTPHFEFQHGHGLGVAFVGSEQPPALHALFSQSNDDAATAEIRNLFATLGERISLKIQHQIQASEFIRGQMFWTETCKQWDEERERTRLELDRASATIKTYEEKIRNQETIIAEQAQILDRQGSILNEQGRILAHHGRFIEEQRSLIGERDRAIAVLSAASGPQSVKTDC